MVYQTQGPVSLDKAIELQKSQVEREILLRFSKHYQDGEHITVEERDAYWEVTVQHSSASDFMTGGAEGYRVDRRTGKVEMIWHERPMKIPGRLEEDSKERDGRG